jgi:hypothetical protein
MNKKGISIIIATIILISICLAITIFSILWYSGIIQKFIFYEKIEIIDVWSKRTFDDYFFIVIDFKNVGTTTVRVCNVYINGKPFKEFAPDTTVDLGSVRTGKELDPSYEETFLAVEPGEIGGVDISFPPYAASVGQKDTHNNIYS